MDESWNCWFKVCALLRADELPSHVAQMFRKLRSDVEDILMDLFDPPPDAIDRTPDVESELQLPRRGEESSFQHAMREEQNRFAAIRDLLNQMWAPIYMTDDEADEDDREVEESAMVCEVEGGEDDGSSEPPIALQRFGQFFERVQQERIKLLADRYLESQGAQQFKDFICLRPDSLRQMWDRIHRVSTELGPSATHEQIRNEAARETPLQIVSRDDAVIFFTPRFNFKLTYATTEEATQASETLIDHYRSPAPQVTELKTKPSIRAFLGFLAQFHPDQLLPLSINLYESPLEPGPMREQTIHVQVAFPKTE